jgi:hypothetical protein
MKRKDSDRTTDARSEGASVIAFSAPEWMDCIRSSSDRTSGNFVSDSSVLKTYLRTVRPTIRMLAWLLALMTVLSWTIGYLAGVAVMWFNS